MSRVHDALRRAEQAAANNPPAPSAPPVAVEEAAEVSSIAVETAEPESFEMTITPQSAPRLTSRANLPANAPVFARDLFSRIQSIPFRPSADSHLIDVSKPHEAPAEEFRSLRTRLNHLQTLQPIHTIVVTSPSPAEGKSFAAMNLALAESQLEGNRTLLIDCDFRRPIAHNLFQMDRTPGMTDYLTGNAELHECIKHIEGTNLYILPAGEAVINPLELLNLSQMRNLLDQLPQAFNWVILDSPPLLFAADASLLSTLCSGTVLVVRIGTTTIDSVTRAMQSLCENNVLGIVVNGARRGELYSKYTYYHSYYYTKPETAIAEPVED